jgi:pimeloyl-ACP methyl ester carboxylesterase
VIVLCHGFLGYKRWGWFPHVASELARAGFHTLTFSFSMNGVDESSGKITRPDQFARNTVSTEIADLNRVMDYLREDMPFSIRPGSVGLFGHSRGGAVAILAAGWRPEVRSLVTWSTPSRLDRYTDRRKRQWSRTGRLTFHDSRAEVPLHLDYSYYLDINANRERYRLPEAVDRMEVPHLIIHGSRDAAVTLKEAHRLTRGKLNGRVKFEVIEGCGHTFGVTDPMELPPPRELKLALDKTTGWFRDTMRD